MATYQVYFPGGQYPESYLPGFNGVDYNPALGDLLSYGTYTTSTSTLAIFQMDNGIDFQIIGTGLTYGPDGVVSGGTITALKLLEPGHTTLMQAITGLNLSGQAFHAAVTSGSSWYAADVFLAGNDTLNGSSGDDELFGLGGADTIKGGAGDDDLCGGRGIDTFDGGTGHDQLTFIDAYNDPAGAHGVKIDATAGTDVDAWGNHETFTNIEEFKGTQFADTMLGSARNEEFRGLGGADVIDGGGGEDEVRYDRDNQVGGYAGVTVNLAKHYAIDGFGTRDTISNIEDARGSIYNDVISGDAGANVLKGRDGDDILSGDLGNDTLDGGSGIDTAAFSSVTAAVAVNLVTGRATGQGTDTLFGIENVTGSSLNDTMTGGVDSNVLLGGSGDDVLNGGLGDDRLDGGAGVDTAAFSGVSAAVTVNLVAGTARGQGSDTLDRVENVVGSSLADTILGNGGVNTLVGGSGNDTLDGGLGNDHLDGGVGIDTAVFGGIAAVIVNLTAGTATGQGTDTLVNVENAIGSAKADTITGDAVANNLNGSGGNDILSGEGGNDTLTGGAGADHFVFHANFGKDKITDFAAGSTSGHDFMTVDHTLFADFAAIQAHAADVGANCVITLDAGDAITLANTHKAALVASDFVFV